jgi:hypothetical protein
MVADFSLENVYKFRWSTPFICAKDIPAGPSGLSAGSVLLIVFVSEKFTNFIHPYYRFFCLVTAYFIGGVIFLKFVRKAEGVEMIPNADFWFSIPGLFKVKNPTEKSQLNEKNRTDSSL